uniref:Fanconi anemia core complex-associated protein 100 n=1 Tax=Eptatretus burgeri TaxID=7764 RepID=A0A8C4Q335_EPTBU
MACARRTVLALGSLGRGGTLSGAPGLACRSGLLYVPCGAGVALFERQRAGNWRHRVVLCLPSEVLWCQVETETGLVLAGCAGGFVYQLPTSSEPACCGLIETCKIGSHGEQSHLLEDVEALSMLPVQGQRIVTLRRRQGHWQLGCYNLKEDQMQLGKGDGGRGKLCLRCTEISPMNLLPCKSADIIHQEKSQQPRHQGYWTEDLLPPLMVLLSSVDCTTQKNLEQTRNSICSSLFRLLFGDVDSPIVVCGLPDGRLVSAPNAGSGSQKLPPFSQALNPLVLHDLKQPLVAIGTAQLPCHPACSGKKFRKEGVEQPNCLVVVGTRGKVVVLTVGLHNDRESLIVREFCVQGPITCAECVEDRLYYSTLCGLHCARLSIPQTTRQDGDRTDGRSSCEETPRTPVESLPPMFHPRSLGIGSCSSMITCGKPEGAVELAMLNRAGRLRMYVTWDRDGEDNDSLLKDTSPGTVCPIQDLIGAIENVSARASSLSSYQQQQNLTLKQLNWVLELVSWLGSHQFEFPATCSGSSPPPLSCSFSMRWTQNLHRDVMSVRCVVRNGTDCTLGESWTLRVSIRGAFLRFGLPEGHPSTVTHTFSMAALPPRRELELALPLWDDAGWFDLLQPVELRSFLQYGSLQASRTDCTSNPITIPLNLMLIDALNCLRTDSSARWDKADANVDESFGKRLCGAHADDIEEGIDAGTKSPLVFVQRFSEEAVQRVLHKPGIQGRQLCTAFLTHLLANCPGLLPPTCAVLDCLGPDDRPVRLAVTQEYTDDVSTLEVRVTCLSMALLCAIRLALARRAKMIMDDESDGQKPQLAATKEKLQEALCNLEGILEEVRSILGKETSSSGPGSTTEGPTEELLNLYLKTRTQSLCV